MGLLLRASSTRNTTSRHLGDQRTRHQHHHDDHHGSSRSSSSSSAHRDPAGFSLLSGATSPHGPHPAPAAAAQPVSSSW
ncbi:unnamed protein product [Gadus morhua 'NCC']